MNLAPTKKIRDATSLPQRPDLTHDGSQGQDARQRAASGSLPFARCAPSSGHVAERDFHSRSGGVARANYSLYADCTGRNTYACSEPVGVAQRDL